MPSILWFKKPWHSVIKQTIFSKIVIYSRTVFISKISPYWSLMQLFPGRFKVYNKYRQRDSSYPQGRELLEPQMNDQPPKTLHLIRPCKLYPVCSSKPIFFVSLLSTKATIVHISFHREYYSLMLPL